MSAMATQITGVSMVCSTVYSDADQRKPKAHWLLWGEFAADRWIHPTKGQWRGKCFHLMTSSWYIYIPHTPVIPRKEEDGQKASSELRTGFLKKNSQRQSETPSLSLCEIIDCIEWHKYINIFFNFFFQFHAMAQRSDFESKGDILSSPGETRILCSDPGTQSPTAWMPSQKPAGLSRID